MSKLFSPSRQRVVGHKQRKLANIAIEKSKYKDGKGQERAKLIRHSK